MMQTDQEVRYRLAKWVIKNLEAEQLLTPDEIEAIWRELLTLFAPPMQSVEVPCGSMLDPMLGVKTSAEGS